MIKELDTVQFTQSLVLSVDFPRGFRATVVAILDGAVDLELVDHEGKGALLTVPIEYLEVVR